MVLYGGGRPAMVTIFCFANDYKVKKLMAFNLQGFSTGKYYIVRAGVDPGYGYKFYVQNDAGQHTILSPWHFGYNFQ